MNGKNQLENINQALRYALTHSEFYKKQLQGVNSLEQWSDLSQFEALPTTSKEDVSHHKKEFWCIDQGEIIDFSATSGTEGKPVIIPLTKSDISRLGDNESGSFQLAGVTQDDIIILTTTIDRQFMAGLAYLEGAKNLGCGIVRTGPGLMGFQWDTIFDLNPTVMIAVPSFLMKLIEYAESNQIPYKNSALKKVICIGEPIRNTDFSLNTLGKKILEKWDLELFSTYASSEMQTAFTECYEGKGGHFNTELIYPEILDKNGSTVPEGIQGELVITNLGVEGMPLVRFKTGDITFLDNRPCSCGHPSPRIGPIAGRKNQMIKVKGTTCFPPAIFDVLERALISTFQIEVYTNSYGNDEVRISIPDSDDISQKKLEDIFRSVLRFRPELNKIPKEEILKNVYTEKSRKPIKFIDLRI